MEKALRVLLDDLVAIMDVHEDVGDTEVAIQGDESDQRWVHLAAKGGSGLDFPSEMSKISPFVADRAQKQ
jgi:hypothetical protein